MARHPHPTLLVFTLGPGREHARRRWLRGEHEALGRELHERCLDEVLAAGRSAGLALRVCTPAGEALAPDTEVDRQSGDGFSGRLLGAVRRARRAVDGPLVVVGTDTPGIDAGVLTEALDGLRGDPETVVLGPATDGGLYLLAASRSVARELAQTEWRSRRTLSTLVAALRRAGRPVRFLPVRGDLDSRGDLERWVSSSAAGLAAAWSGLLTALRSALVRSAFLPLAPAPVPVAARRTHRASRAPPR